MRKSRGGQSFSVWEGGQVIAGVNIEGIVAIKEAALFVETEERQLIVNHSNAMRFCCSSIITNREHASEAIDLMTVGILPFKSLTRRGGVYS